MAPLYWHTLNLGFNNNNNNNSDSIPSFIRPHLLLATIRHPQVSSNSETGEIIISGMGELHLEIYVERMKREYKVECEVRR